MSARILSVEEWRTIVDSLFRRDIRAPKCSQGCGHLETTHDFSTHSSPYCDLNCRRCRGWAS